jgi:hypothetical protein
MTAKKTPGTVKTLQARPKVAAKTATTKSAGGTKKAAAKRITVKLPVVGGKAGKKTSLDVLRLFMQAYEDL